MVNQQQVMSIVRWAMTSAGSYAVGRGWITADQAELILGAAAMLVPLAWSFYVHKDA